MNDLFRLLSKTLHPFGYQVRPRQGLNFLRVPALEGDSALRAVRTQADSGLARTAEGNCEKLTIYLRTCFRDGRNIETRPRITGTDINLLGLRCIHSLLQSIKYALWQEERPQVELVILDDRSDPVHRERLQKLLTLCPVPVSFETTQQAGQGASLHQQFQMARGKDALVYFCEDDYLHAPDAIITLWRFYKEYARKTGGHLVLYPQEHHILYDHHYPSYIVHGQDRHWRSMRHATHTFLTHGSIVEKYWNYFENTKYVGNKKKRKLGSEARTTNRLFRHIPGFCPLKPCALHFQFEEFIPPYCDWKPLWDKSALPDDLTGAP